MAEILISDIWSSQSSASLAITGAEKVVCENPATTNKFGLITPDALFTWLNTTKTLLTDAEVDALIAAAIAGLSGGGDLYVYYTGMTFVETGGIRKGTLGNAMYCRDSTNAYNIAVATGFCKYMTSTFTAGTNQGGLDTGSFATNRIYYIWAIYNSTTAASDILYSLSNSAPTMPSGYDKKRMIGAVYHINYDSEQFIQWTFQDFDESGKIKPKIPANYINPDMSVTSKYVDYEITFDNIHVMDSTNTYELHMPQSVTKLVNAVWAEGDDEGINDLTLVEETWYYLYIIMNPSTGAIDYYLDASATSPTLPSGYTVYRLIGLFYFIDDSVYVYFAHSINEKWDDKNFDIANLAKIGQAGAPAYEALFTGDGNTIKVSTFADAADSYIDAGTEFPHDGKNDTPIHFHAHAYPEDNAVKDVVFFVDYLITNEGDTSVIAAPTRLTETVTLPGVKGEQFIINFNWIVPATGRLVEGSQLWFTFGRLGTDGADDYTGKIAVRTFGFHYLRDKIGSDMETTNL